MSLSQKWQGFMAIGMCTTLMAGCGASPLSTSPARNDGPLLLERTVLSQMDGQEKPSGLMDMVEALKLTDEQKTKIKALKDAFKPGITMEDLKTLGAQLKEQLLADEVDKAKMTTLLMDAFDKKQAHMTAVADLMVKVREILTDDQRKALAVAILDKMATKGKDKAQKMDDSTTKDKVHKHKRGFRKMAAVASFMLTGDKETLTTAFTMTNKEEIVQKLVDKFAGMSKESRQKLVDKATSRTETAKL